MSSVPRPELHPEFTLPVLAVNLQPAAGMDHANFDTGRWPAYCGACPLPELANTFLRLGVEFRSVSGYLEAVTSPFRASRNSATAPPGS